MDFIDIAKKAKEASLEIADLSEDIKNKALSGIADKIVENKEEIFLANKQDLEAAKELIEKGEISQSTYNRLKLDENKLRDMVKGIRDIVNLPDPINKKLLVRELDKDLTLYKISCPIGVL
jgi:glutamate-5-semialdehyde dehydrogenase